MVVSSVGTFILIHILFQSFSVFLSRIAKTVQFYKVESFLATNFMIARERQTITPEEKSHSYWQVLPPAEL